MRIIQNKANSRVSVGRVLPFGTWSGDGGGTEFGVPLNIMPPVISGDFIVGSSLTAGGDTWLSDLPIISKTYIWQARDPDLPGVSITHTGDRWTLPESMLNMQARVGVSASNGSGDSEISYSDWSPVIQPANLAPLPLTTPSMIGDSSPEGIISVVAGTYSGNPSPRVRWRWQQADAADGPWSALLGLGTVSSINKADYDLAGKFVRAQEQADNSQGQTGFINPSNPEYIGPIEESVEGGPLRTPTPSLPLGIVLGGHSSLQPINYDNILQNAVGPVMTDGDKQSSKDVWDSNGPARTASYNLLILSESDGDNYQGIADPASAQGMENLQYLYWLGLEAKDRGAELALFNSPSARSNPVDATNRQRMNYYRQWLETHLDMPVWVIPGELYVQELRNRGLTDAEIFRDNVHLADGAVSRGAAYQGVAFVTGDLPSGIPSGDQLYADAALASVEAAWWAGLGGSEYEVGLSIPDPLPDPLPRPGEPEPVDGILWTAQGYQGPELTGNQPVIADGVMTFDGTGLHGPFVTQGFYACMSIRPGDLAGAGALLFVNPDPANVYADPYHGLRLSADHGNYMAERWPDPGEIAFRPYDGAGWTVVEGWVSGMLVGGFDGAEDAGGVSESDAPETPSIMILSYGRPVEVAYLRVAKTMPTTEQRSAYRAEAQATITQ